MPQYELDDLREVRADLDRLETRLRELVAVARDAGDSWEDIGRAIGTSRQAAWERYGTRNSEE